MIVDFYEAVDVLMTAVAVWIVIGVATATAVGYGLAVLVWCAWTTLRRGVSGAMAWRALRRAQAPAEGTQSPADGFRNTGEPPEPPGARTEPLPALTQTDRKAA